MKSVLLTRSIEDNALWANELRARGFVPIECACIETTALEGGSQLASALQSSDWLAFTSRRAVDALHNEVQSLPSALRLAAVGPATAERLRERFGRCDLESREGTGAGLGKALVEAGATTPIVITAEGGRTDVEGELAAASIQTSRLEMYTTSKVSGLIAPEARSVDAAFFASPSAVHAFMERGQLDAGCTLISIGPTTSAALLAAGLPVHAESHTRDLDGMLTALATLSQSQR